LKLGTVVVLDIMSKPVEFVPACFWTVAEPEMKSLYHC